MFMENFKIICACCGKQIVNYPVSTNDYYCTNGPITPMGPTLGYACKTCSYDLDEFGMFPEEIEENMEIK